MKNKVFIVFALYKKARRAVYFVRKYTAAKFAYGELNRVLPG